MPEDSLQELEQTAKSLEKFPVDEASVSFWVVKRYLSGGIGHYNVYRVEIEDKLQNRLRRILREGIKSTAVIEAYDFITGDQDDQVYGLESESTDFERIRKSIEELDAKRIRSFEELMGTWAYVVRLEGPAGVLYGIRKVSSDWSVKRVKKVVSLVFEGEVLVDLDEKRVFRIEEKFDFLAFKGYLFILDKKQFEVAMNFRVGMERNRDTLLEEFEALGLFDNIGPIRDYVGKNLTRLRKLATINKRGYFRDDVFMELLRNANVTQELGLEIVDAKISVTEDTVELVLTLIGNDRLASIINQELFDVAVKKLVVKA